MAVLKKKYKIWETEYYFIEAVLENIWWENIINEFLFSIFDLIHLSFGPRAINSKNGARKGTISF
jgi:hypothetical protein